MENKRDDALNIIYTRLRDQNKFVRLKALKTIQIMVEVVEFNKEGILIGAVPADFYGIFMISVIKRLTDISSIVISQSMKTLSSLIHNNLDFDNFNI